MASLFRFRLGWGLLGVLHDAVDAEGEVRSAAEGGFLKRAVHNAFVGFALIGNGAGRPVHDGHVAGRGGNGLAVHGEGGGIEDLQAAVAQSGFNLGDLLSGTGGAGRAKSGDGNRAVVIALRPVGAISSPLSAASNSSL